MKAKDFLNQGIEPTKEGLSSKGMSAEAFLNIPAAEPAGELTAPIPVQEQPPTMFERGKEAVTEFFRPSFAPERTKGPGFLGTLQRPDGDISTELSVGVNLDGKEAEIPTLVPNLDQSEIDYLLSGGKPTDAIVGKAVEHAKMRISKGQSPFKGDVPAGMEGMPESTIPAGMSENIDARRDEINARLGQINAGATTDSEAQELMGELEDLKQQEYGATMTRPISTITSEPVPTPEEEAAGGRAAMAVIPYGFASAVRGLVPPALERAVMDPFMVRGREYVSPADEALKIGKYMPSEAQTAVGVPAHLAGIVAPISACARAAGAIMEAGRLPLDLVLRTGPVVDRIAGHIARGGILGTLYGGLTEGTPKGMAEDAAFFGALEGGLGAAGGIFRKIFSANWYRNLEVKERGLVVQSLDDMMARGYSEGEILKQWNNPMWREEALARRATGEPSPKPAAPSLSETQRDLAKEVIREEIAKGPPVPVIPEKPIPTVPPMKIVPGVPPVVPEPMAGLPPGQGLEPVEPTPETKLRPDPEKIEGSEYPEDAEIKKNLEETLRGIEEREGPKIKEKPLSFDDWAANQPAGERNQWIRTRLNEQGIPLKPTSVRGKINYQNAAGKAAKEFDKIFKKRYIEEEKPKEPVAEAEKPKEPWEMGRKEWRDKNIEGRWAVVGSQIRGTASKSSDIDFLTVLTKEEWGSIITRDNIGTPTIHPKNLPSEILEKWETVRGSKGKTKTGDILIGVPTVEGRLDVLHLTGTIENPKLIQVGHPRGVVEGKARGTVPVSQRTVSDFDIYGTSLEWHKRIIQQALKSGKLTPEKYAELHEKDYGLLSEFMPEAKKVVEPEKVTGPDPGGLRQKIYDMLNTELVDLEARGISRGVSARVTQANAVESLKMDGIISRYPGVVKRALGYLPEISTEARRAKLISKYLKDGIPRKEAGEKADVELAEKPKPELEIVPEVVEKPKPEVAPKVEKKLTEKDITQKEFYKMTEGELQTEYAKRGYGVAIKPGGRYWISDKNKPLRGILKIHSKEALIDIDNRVEEYKKLAKASIEKKPPEGWVLDKKREPLTETKSRLLKNIKSEKGSSELINDLSRLGADAMKRGHTTYKAFTAEMKKILSGVWAKVKDLMRKAYFAAKKLLKSERGAVEIGKPRPKPKDEYIKITEILKTATKEVREVWDGIKEMADEYLGAISTRLANIDPSLKAHLRSFEYKTGTTKGKRIRQIQPFLEKIKGMNKEDKVAFDLARKNADAKTLQRLIIKYNLDKEYKATRFLLNKMYTEAKGVGYKTGYRKHFHPRVIKDQKGFLEYLMKQEDWPLMDRAIRAREVQLGRYLEEDEKAQVINSLLRGFGRDKIMLSIPGQLKAREIETIWPELNKFYMDSDAALLRYIGVVTDAIEARKVFGVKSKNKKATPGTLENDINDTIGHYVLDLLAKGKIRPDQEHVLREIYQARFNEVGTRGVVGLYKNLSYIDTMGSPISAITQIGDLAWALYKAGIPRTFEAAWKAVVGRSAITKEDLGIERIAQEFADTSKSARAVTKVFKVIGLEKIDNIGKEALINATLKKVQGQAKNPKKVDALRKELEPIFEQETDALIDDLQNDRISENVKLYLFNTLLDFQPVAPSEMTEKYLTGGNGRIFYMLKTFTLKQFDVYRREIFQQIGKPGTRLKGMKNLITLASCFVAANASADIIKSLMLNRPLDLDDLTVDNLLRLIGISKFVTWKARQEGVGSAMVRQVAPPFKFADALSKDIWQAGDEKGLETVSSIPVLGKFYYWWFGKGVGKSERRRKKLEPKKKPGGLKKGRLTSGLSGSKLKSRLK